MLPLRSNRPSVKRRLNGSKRRSAVMQRQWLGVVGKGLFSRNRKAYPHLENIVAELGRSPGQILDGELYSDKLTFQELVGIVKKEKLKMGDEEKQLAIKYHIYDVMNGEPYDKRLAMLNDLFRENRFQHLVLVQTMASVSEEQIKEQHATFIANGYEGIMLRAKGGLFKHSRSVDLLKYKEFFDAEYEIVGYEQGVGLEKGCVIWRCQTIDGGVFMRRPCGTREDRQDLFLHGEEYVGKYLTVRYQELTSSDLKVPRFSVGISVRDYE